MRIYLAGPDVFRSNAKEYGKALSGLVDKLGHEALFPLDNEIGTTGILKLDAHNIFKGNVKMINQCDMVLANVERFRGPSLDPGTAFELGMAYALGKKIVLYNSDGGSYKFAVGGKVTNKYPRVEDFQLFDNLMIACCTDKIYSNVLETLEAL